MALWIAAAFSCRIFFRPPWQLPLFQKTAAAEDSATPCSAGLSGAACMRAGRDHPFRTASLRLSTPGSLQGYGRSAVLRPIDGVYRQPGPCAAGRFFGRRHSSPCPPAGGRCAAVAAGDRRISKKRISPIDKGKSPAYNNSIQDFGNVPDNVTGDDFPDFFPVQS